MVELATKFSILTLALIVMFYLPVKTNYPSDDAEMMFDCFEQ